MIVEELGRIPMSPNLAASLQRASDYAAAQSHVEVTLEHLLLALTQDPDAGQVLEASHVDLSRLEADVSTHLGRIEERFQPGEPLRMTVSGELKRILEASAAAAAKGRRREINGAIVLAAIVGDGRTVAAHMLRAQGLTFEEAIRVLRAPPAPQPRQPAPASMPPLPAAPPPVADQWEAMPNQPMPPPPRPQVGNGYGAPQTEDILASARERVQSRAHRPVAQSASEPEWAPYEPPLATAPPPISEGNEPPSDAGYDPEAAEPWPQLEPPPAPATSHPPPAPQTEPHWAPAAGPVLPAEPGFRPHAGGSGQPPPPSVRQPQLHPPYTPPPIPASRPAPPPPPVERTLHPPYPPQPMTPGAAPPSPARAAAPAPAAPPQYRERPSPQPYAPWPEHEPEPRKMETRQHAPGPLDASRPAPPHSRGLEDRRRPAPMAVEAGQLVENVPRRMRVGVPMTVEARIAKASVKAIAEGMHGVGAAHHHDVLVTKAMSVRLRAPDGGFWIETTSPETQWIETVAGLMSDDFASWRWTVTPRSSGRKRLQLVVSARTVGADGLTAETALPDQVIEVSVGINYVQTAKTWGGWVLAALLGGLIQRFGESAIADGLKSLIALVMG